MGVVSLSSEVPLRLFSSQMSAAGAQTSFEAKQP